MKAFSGRREVCSVGWGRLVGAGFYEACGSEVEWQIMEMKLTLPDEVAGKLGDEPEREVLEGVLLLLVGEGKLSLERAGAILGLDGEEAARWHAELTRSSSEGDDAGKVELEILNLEDMTQEELDLSERFLRITPAKEGSGFSDVSINHDKYLYGSD